MRFFCISFLSSYSLCFSLSPEASLGVANAGLNYMHSNFEFINTTNGEVAKFDDYMTKGAKNVGSFETGSISGNGAKGNKDNSFLGVCIMCMMYMWCRWMCCDCALQE